MIEFRCNTISLSNFSLYSSLISMLLHLSHLVTYYHCIFERNVSCIFIPIFRTYITQFFVIINKNKYLSVGEQLLCLS
jgi:hypothetical protein